MTTTGRKKKDKTADSVGDQIHVLEVSKGRIDVCVLGTSEHVHNRLSEKVKRELLFPKGKENASARALRLKHEPLEEFRNSPHRLVDESAPTYLAAPAAAFKKAMMTAALDLPDTKKAQIGRLTWVEGRYVPVYGVPQLFMAPVRSADMNHTPDIRTRAIVPRWACKFTVTYVKPLMQSQAVVRLLTAAGLFIGVGDGRNEKGTFSFGAFTLVEPDNPEFLDIIATGGRLAQVEAMRAPTCYDEESEELLSWFYEELKRRKQRGLPVGDVVQTEQEVQA